MLPLREFPTRIQRAWCLPLVLGAALVLPAAEADAQERPLWSSRPTGSGRRPGGHLAALNTALTPPEHHRLR